MHVRAVLRSLVLLPMLVLAAGPAAAQGAPADRSAGATTEAAAPFDASFSHHTAEVNGVRLHYVIGGEGPPVVLLHGWPQTWYEWHKIMPALAERYTVIAPDYRGAGYSSKPPGGYDKATMAEDIHALVEHLGFDRIHLVGHDIGLMVAYAYAAQYPDEVAKLVLMEVPLPGTRAFEAAQRDPAIWHFDFHRAPGIPEMLVEGREREYLTAFYRGPFTYDPAAITEEDIGRYVAAYRMPGALRAGFELYRAFPQDVEDNERFLETKLRMPVLALGGEASFGEAIVPMVEEAALDVRGGAVPEAGHWVAEENPEYLVGRLLDSFGEAP